MVCESSAHYCPGVDSSLALRGASPEIGVTDVRRSTYRLFAWSQAPSHVLLYGSPERHFNNSTRQVQTVQSIHPVHKPHYTIYISLRINRVASRSFRWCTFPHFPPSNCCCLITLYRHVYAARIHTKSRNPDRSMSGHAHV